MYVSMSPCSCLGLSDLLVSRHIGEVAKYIAQLWELVLRARDDIKVRVEEKWLNIYLNSGS